MIRLIDLAQFSFLEGYRTTIIAVALVIAIVVEKVIGFDVPGFDPGADWVTVLLVAFGLRTAAEHKPA